ncbi:MAG: sigma-70 family RNA polymerase sigma factor [Aeromicrobium sp.]
MTEYEVARIGEDADQLEAFYREHLRVVERFVARRVGDPETAADLTADVFLAAIAASVDYRGDRGAPVVWLLGIARNVVASEHRRSGRERRAARRFSGRRLLDEESTARIVERLDAERETRRIYSALAVLPDHDRALLELVALDGLTVTDAATVLGLRPGTARVRLHRLRERVQGLLGPTVLTPHAEEVL